jgi:TetR/AcrR family transcriptional repressor of nem operon
MRYGKEHKEETHKKVVEAASRRFRKDGIEATGVVDLMADVGLTHGGFYAHFSSKETLVKEAIATASLKSRTHLEREIERRSCEAI